MRKIAKREKCSRRRSPEGKPSRNTRSGRKSRRAPGLVILRYGGSPARKVVSGGTSLIGQGLPRQYGTASRLTRRLRSDGISYPLQYSHLTLVLSFLPTTYGKEMGWIGRRLLEHLVAVCLLRDMLYICRRVHYWLDRRIWRGSRKLICLAQSKIMKSSGYLSRGRRGVCFVALPEMRMPTNPLSFGPSVTG